MFFITNIFVALFAYMIDKRFGEFTFIKHPVILMGDLITFFEKKLYSDSILRGFFLVLCVLCVIGFMSYVLEIYLAHFNFYIHFIINAVIASIFIAHRMLKDSVKEIIFLETIEEKRESISMLVSRDTKDLSESDIYKAAIETYAENLSDGVIAPLFYLIIFGLPGIILYKAINTMDSMIGYKNERYEKFGKVAARLDDVANFIPSRITALLIVLLYQKKFDFTYLETAKLHESPNAGYPISAMAQVLELQLGGDTSYFGKIKKKPFFGSGKTTISKTDLQKMFGSVK